MKVRLDSVCKINMGQSPDSSTYNDNKEGIPFFQGNADFGDIYPNIRKWCSNPIKIANKNDILLSVRAPIGAMNIANCECCIGRGLAALTVNSDVCLNKYLWYLMSNKVELLNSMGTGSTFKAINKTVLSQLSVYIPSITEQSRIVMTLDKVNDLIAKRHKQLEKLDELVKAKFVEMFGTLLNPSSSFKYDFLKNLCKKITDGKHGGCAKQDGSGHYFIGARDIFDDKVHYEHALEINIDEFKKDYKRCNVEIGDFLIVNTGATIGKSAIACDLRTTRTLLQKSVALLKLNTELLNPVFLKYCYKINENMYKVKSASAQPNLLLSEIKMTSIYVPSMELQNEFFEFVKCTEKFKDNINESLCGLEVLKKSLMQKFFTGSGYCE